MSEGRNFDLIRDREGDTPLCFALISCQPVPIMSINEGVRRRRLRLRSDFTSFTLPFVAKQPCFTKKTLARGS